MSDKVSPGDGFDIRANAWNDLIDLRDAEKARAGRTPPMPPGKALAPDLIKVKNLTGADLGRGRVVQVGAKLIDTLDREHLWFEGLTPEASCGVFAILKRPLPEDEIGEAFIAGACLARVSVLATSHRYAFPTDGQTALTSGLDGPFQILNPATSTGEQELAVVVGAIASGRRLAKLNEELIQGGTANAAEIIWTGSAWEYSGITFTVADFWLNEGESVPEDTKIWAEWFCNVWVPLPYCLPSDTLPEA